MRAGAERLMSCVVQTTGGARAHHGHLFANARAAAPVAKDSRLIAGRRERRRLESVTSRGW
jgi:hypothetical protein